MQFLERQPLTWEAFEALRREHDSARMELMQVTLELHKERRAFLHMSTLSSEAYQQLKYGVGAPAPMIPVQSKEAAPGGMGTQYPAPSIDVGTQCNRRRRRTHSVSCQTVPALSVDAFTETVPAMHVDAFTETAPAMLVDAFTETEAKVPEVVDASTEMEGELAPVVSMEYRVAAPKWYRRKMLRSFFVSWAWTARTNVDVMRSRALSAFAQLDKCRDEKTKLALDLKNANKIASDLRERAVRAEEKASSWFAKCSSAIAQAMNSRVSYIALQDEMDMQKKLLDTICQDKGEFDSAWNRFRHALLARCKNLEERLEKTRQTIALPTKLAIREPDSDGKMGTRLRLQGTDALCIAHLDPEHIGINRQLNDAFDASKLCLIRIEDF